MIIVESLLGVVLLSVLASSLRVAVRGLGQMPTNRCTRWATHDFLCLAGLLVALVYLGMFG